jgi:hypothetical protein
MRRFSKAVLTLAFGAGMFTLLSAASSRVASLADFPPVDAPPSHHITVNSIGDMFASSR